MPNTAWKVLKGGGGSKGIELAAGSSRKDGCGSFGDCLTSYPLDYPPIGTLQKVVGEMQGQ